jgi:hypothetical protein
MPGLVLHQQAQPAQAGCVRQGAPASGLLFHTYLNKRLNNFMQQKIRRFPVMPLNAYKG